MKGRRNRLPYADLPAVILGRAGLLIIHVHVTHYIGYVKQASSTRANGQWLAEQDGQTWWFDSGSISLDFGYATFINPADLAHWLSQRFDRVEQAATERELRDAEGLADAIARVAIARTREVSATPEDIDIINLYAAMPDVPPSLTGGRRQAGAGTVRPAQALASVARMRSTCSASAAPDAFAAARHPTATWCSSTAPGPTTAAGARCSAAATGPRCGRTGSEPWTPSSTERYRSAVRRPAARCFQWFAGASAAAQH